MQDKGELIRLPARLFKGEDLHLPLNSLGFEGSQITLKLPKRFLEDQSIVRLVYDEYHSEGFEALERLILMELIPEDGIFLDVGAHFGLYSIFLAHYKSGLNCYAFEPEPDNFSVLSKNCTFGTASQRIFCYQNAVGAQSGVGVLRVNTSMGHHVVRSEKNNLDRNFLEIEIYTLDDIFSKIYQKYSKKKSSWIKIDVEGREMDVLLGGNKFLRSGLVDGILWEHRVGSLENPYKNDIIRFLGSLGFSSYTASESNTISLRDCAEKNESQFQIIKRLLRN